MNNIKPLNIQPKDENGKPHGEWLIYHLNSNIDYRGNYIHGVAHGFCEWYNNDGTVWYRGYRNMGRQVGYWHWYNKECYHLCLI